MQTYRNYLTINMLFLQEKIPGAFVALKGQDKEDANSKYKILIHNIHVHVERFSIECHKAKTKGQLNLP